MRSLIRGLLRRVLPRSRKVREQPSVLFMVGVARSGTTLAKRFLGEHPDLEILPYGMPDRLLGSLPGRSNRILIDKRTENLPILPYIHGLYGNRAWYLGVIRDPRDTFLSLSEIDRHLDLPRDETFFDVWAERNEALLQFAEEAEGEGTRVAIVRYEDLVADPEARKKAFLSWLGLDAGGIDDRYDPGAGATGSVIGSEDPKAHSQTRVSGTSVGRWRSAAPERLVIIRAGSRRTGAERLMARFGYREGGPGEVDLGGAAPLL